MALLKNSLKLRSLEDNDLIKLPLFLSEGFPSKTPELWRQRFKMWWEDNPVMNDDIQRGWILEQNDSEILGFMGNIPFKYQINGKENIAVAATSWYIRPEAQGMWSIKIAFAFLAQKNVGLFLSTSPDKTVQKMLKPLGFSDLSLPFNNAHYWYIQNLDKIFNLFLIKLKKSNRLIFPFVKTASFFIKIISKYALKILKKKITKYRQNNYICRSCSHCDISFTEIWGNNKKDNVTTLYRDSETLNWLYFSDAVNDKRYVFKCITKDENKLVGYFVFDIISPQNRDIKILELKDAYAPKINKDIIYSLIKASIELAKKKDIHAVVLWPINEEMDKVLKKILKIKRKCKSLYFFKFNKSEERRIQENKNHKFIPSPIDPDRGAI